MQPDRAVTHCRKAAHKGAARLVLFLVGVDDNEGDDLAEWDVADYPGDQLGDLAKEIIDSAQMDADERGGSRKYRVQGQDGEGIQVYKWQLRMTAERRDDGGRDPAPTLELDEPTAQGLLAQAMRHQERQFSVCMASQERIVRSLQDQLAQRDKRIAQLEQRELEVIETLRALRLQNVDGAAAERNADRIDRALTLITEKFLPAAGVQFGILPEGFDPSKGLEGLKQKLLFGEDDKPAEGDQAGDETIEPPSSSSAEVAPDAVA